MLSSRLLLVGPLALTLLIFSLLPSPTTGDESLVDAERWKREPLPVAAPLPGDQAAPARPAAAKPEAANGKGTKAKKAKNNKPKGKSANADNKKVKKAGGKTSKKGKKGAAKNNKGEGKKNKGTGKKIPKGKAAKSKDKKKNKGKKLKKGAKKQRKGKQGKNKKKKTGKNGKAKKQKTGKNGKTKKQKTGKNGKAKKGNGNTKPRGSVKAQNDSCVTNLASILGTLGNQLRSVDQAGNRIKNALILQGRKLEKSGDFNGSAQTLLSALGGNLSKPKCGSTDLDNKSQPLGNLSVLNRCNTSVLSTCVGGEPPASIKNCLTLVATFRNASQKITAPGQTADQICAAVGAFNLSLVSAVISCQTLISAATPNITANRNNCTKAFGECRQSQRNIIGSIFDCKPGPGGAASKEDAAVQLNATNNLRNAAVSMVNSVTTALAAAGVASGPGADGNLPATGRASRQRRQTADGPKCTEIEKGLQAANTSAASAVPNSAASVDLGSASTATTAMNTVANNPTLAADLGTCAKTTRQIVIVAIIRIRIFIFWINNWRITIVEIKITLLVVSFGLPSPSTVAPITTTPTTPATTTSSVVTKAPSGGRRERVFQLLNKAHINFN